MTRSGLREVTEEKDREMTKSLRAKILVGHSFHPHPVFHPIDENLGGPTFASGIRGSQSFQAVDSLYLASLVRYTPFYYLVLCGAETRGSGGRMYLESMYQ